MTGMIHFNPKTGETGKCGAKTEDGCPFRGDSDHYPTHTAARDAYEDFMREELEETLRTGRKKVFSRYNNTRNVSERSIMDIECGEFEEYDSGLQWQNDGNWNYDDKNAAVNETWRTIVDYQSGTFSEAVFEKDKVTVSLYGGDDGKIDEFVVDRTEYDESNEDLRVFRANVMLEASDMIVKNVPYYTKGGQVVQAVMEEYESGLMDFDGMDMVKMNDSRPETWKVEGKMDKGVESVKVHYHYGKAEFVVTTSSGYGVEAGEHVLHAEENKYDKSLGDVPPKTGFKNSANAALFFMKAEKSYADFIKQRDRAAWDANMKRNPIR